MTQRVDPGLLHELKEFGAVGIEKCYNCGNCTASCPLATDEHPFPRDVIRLAQLGLKDRLASSLDPWFCYYCGDCSTTCPRGAEPAETMMATRRWLTAQYDRTGHGKRLYTSEKAVWITIARISLVTLAFFVIYLWLGWGQIITSEVALNSFAPVLLIWAFVLLHFLYLGVRLLINSYRMFKLAMNPLMKEYRVPTNIYFSELKTFITHILTQKRWRDCGVDAHQRWLKHLLLVTGYVTMLVLVVGLLGWFQTDNIYPIYHPQRWLGYYATVVLIFTSADALLGRRRKKEQIHRFSQPTDWLFPAFILVGSITGIFVHIFRYAGWPWPTYIIYVVHVMAMIAMLDTEVGIGKWSHLIYRPLAIYLEAVKVKTKQQHEAAAGALAPAD